MDKLDYSGIYQVILLIDTNSEPVLSFRRRLKNK